MVSLSQVQSAPDGAVWKTTRMRGFLTKVAGTDGAFTLRFKNAAGTTYDYAVDGATLAITAPSTKITLDGEFMGLVMSDWQRLSASDAAAVAAGTGSW